jgi:hypothetical protein
MGKISTSRSAKKAARQTNNELVYIRFAMLGLLYYYADVFLFVQRIGWANRKFSKNLFKPPS